MNAHSESRTRRLLIAAVTLLCAGAAQAWTVTADPPAGPPGSQVTVSGQRFPPNSRIQAFLKWRTCAADTDARGNFNCRLKVPHVAQPGPDKIWTVHRPTGQWFPTAFTVRTDWGNEAFDGGRTRYNPYENVLNRSNVGGLKRLWRAPGTLQLVAGGRVFLKPSDSEAIAALDEATGNEVWRMDMVTPVQSLAAAQGRLYVAHVKPQVDPARPPPGSELMAVSTADGSVLWTTDVGFGAVFDERSSVAVNPTAPGLIYLSSETDKKDCAEPVNFQLQAVGASDGQTRWASGIYGWREGVCGDATFSEGFANSLVTESFVYTEYVELYRRQSSSVDFYFSDINRDDVFNADSGTSVRWRSCTRINFYPGGGDFCSSEPASFEPVLKDVQLLLASDNFLLYHNGRVENAADGQAIQANWRGSGAGGVPALARDIVYTGGDLYPGLYAVRASDGALLWRRSVSGNVAIQPTVANGVVYLGRNAYDARNGNWLWSNPDLVDTVSPIVVNGRLYANQTDGTVSAWGLQ